MTAAIFNPPGIIPRLTGGWVRLYTTGMTGSARSRRRLEIDSDLWEHFADRAADASPAVTNIEMFSRLVRGIPSDIAWRFQAEGFHMNINIPLERIAGILLLFLIIPFIAGASISGYDFDRSEWPSEFQRFSDMSSRYREITGLLHGAIGLLLIAGAAQFLAMLRDKSPRLVTLGTMLLMAAGTIMLVNAAVYRAMSALADDYLASGDQSLVVTARGFGVAMNTLAMANMSATTVGILSLSVALTRLALVPRWTAVLPTIGLTSLVGMPTVGSVSGEAEWTFLALGFLSVGLWLLICGAWLLFGGSKLQPLSATAAPAA